MADGFFSRITERRRRRDQPESVTVGADGTGTNATLIIIAAIFVLGFVLAALFRQIEGAPPHAGPSTGHHAPAGPGRP